MHRGRSLSSAVALFVSCLTAVLRLVHCIGPVRSGTAKGKETKSIYIAPFILHTQTWITQFYLQITPCLPLAPLLTEVADIQLQLTTHLWTRRDERLSWPGWLNYSGRFTHINGHPSATGRAQDWESSPAKDRRSTTVPHSVALFPLLPTRQGLLLQLHVI